jgi:H+/Cl- antiporter ClcA
MGARTPLCLPEPPDHPVAVVVAGMGAPFAAIVRALTGIVLMVEMIDSYAHTLPFCVVCCAAYAVAVHQPDTVGQPPNTQNHASHLSSLKAQKPLESNAVTAAVSRGKRMTNSIRPLNRHGR